MDSPFTPDERIGIRSTAEMVSDDLKELNRSHYWRFYGNCGLAFVGTALTVALLALVIELGYLVVYLLPGCGS